MRLATNVFCLQRAGDGHLVGAGDDRAAVGEDRELVAVDRDAEVRTGGRVPERDGYFYKPTVLSSVSADADILQHEIFGPVAPIVSFDTEDEAIAMANDTNLGLISYVYTEDLGRGLRVAEALEAGMVAINKGLVSDPAAPFGGVKQSGIGKEGSHEGILEYLETKYVGVSW